MICHIFFCRLSLEEKYQIVRSIGEECIQEDELRNLLEKKPEPVCYDGFEPSGRMHIAQVTIRRIFESGLQIVIFFFFNELCCISMHSGSYKLSELGFSANLSCLHMNFSRKKTGERERLSNY